MKIYILDDDESFRQYLTLIINAYLSDRHPGYEVFKSEFDDRQLRQYISKDMEPALFFLDIVISDKEGVRTSFDIAEEIKAANKENYIVFLTDYSQIIQDEIDYKLLALGIIRKESKKRDYEVKYILDKVLGIATESGLVFTMQDYSKQFISLPNIDFIEHAEKNNTITIYYNNGFTDMPGALSTISEKLDHRFFRCHKSYIVNMEKIDRIDTQNRLVHMKNGYICKISVRQKRAFINEYSRFCDKNSTI